MSTLTKAQTRTLIKALIPDAKAEVWTPAILDVLIQLVMDELWAEILDDAPWYISKVDTLVAGSMTSPGYIDVSTAGPLSRRFYKLQRLVRNQQEYSEGSVKDGFVTSTVSPNVSIGNESFTRTIYGSQLWSFPLDITIGAEVRYSYFPAAFTSLAETAVIEWPDGFESAFVNEVLARVSVEDNRVARFHAIAEAAMSKLKNKAKHESIGPMVMSMYSEPIEWGSI